jgi:glycosyltransferase 2 family protein
MATILLGAGLLMLLIWQIGPDALWRDLCLLGWGLVVFILMEGIVDIFHTVGWRYCLSGPLRSVSFFRLFGIRLAGSSINYVTPTADLGGEVIKGSLLSLDHPGPEAATGVIIGKLSYALSQLLFVVLGSTLILWKIDLPTAGSAAMFTGSILLGAGIVGFLVVQKHGKLGVVVRWLVAHNIGGDILKKAASQITQVDQALQQFYQERPRDLPLSMSWHMLGMTFSIIKTWYFLLLLTDGSFFAAAGIWFLGTWFSLITFAIPMGIGVQEGSRVIAFKALGFDYALGLSYGIALRLEQIFWAGAGLLIYVALLAQEGERGLLSRTGASIKNLPAD